MQKKKKLRINKYKSLVNPATWTDSLSSSYESKNILHIKYILTLISKGRSFSMSSLPNLQPGGMISSLQRASKRVLSHTNDVYNSAKPLRTLSPNSEPQCVMDSVRISLWNQPLECISQLHVLNAPGKTALHNHWRGGSVGPRASLEGMEKRKISCPAMNWTLIPWLSSISTD